MYAVICFPAASQIFVHASSRGSLVVYGQEPQIGLPRTQVCHQVDVCECEPEIGATNLGSVSRVAVGGQSISSEAGRNQ